MSAPFYYKFESCCTGKVLFFLPPVAVNASIYTYNFPQVLSYDPGGNLGDQDGLISGDCYLITLITGDGSPNLPLGANWMSLLDGRTTCFIDGEQFGECNQCPPCYLIMTCDGSIAPFTTTQDLSAYLYSVIGHGVVLSGTDLGERCVQVTLAPASVQCNIYTETLVYVEDCVCECNCYEVIASAKDCYYLDCDGNFHNTGSLTGTMISIPCASTTPWIVGNFNSPQGPSPIYITNIGPCIDGECPTQCYILEDCDGILDPIYTNKVSLGIYAILGQVVILDDYPDTCWEVTDTAECDCAIDVTVLQVYDDCPTCKNASNYKLTNCDNSNLIVYTSTDLSSYVGQVIIRLDCPGCWYVEEIDNIPSDTPITVDVSYIDCIECGRKYFELTDCTGYKDPIITYTDLSAYVGSVIKILYCPETCWIVSETLIATNAGIVIPDVEYVDCPECLLTFPCVCTTVRNDSTVSRDYRYYDCNLDVQFFTLASGEKSERFCMRVWAIYYPETDYIETFGDCTENPNDIWSCPAKIYPRRSIQPGYNTPACTISKYEKISCKAAEIYYKQVLYLRYGISNCCPDDSDKWLIKKELIDLDAQRDPAYECTVVSSCCPNTPSCGNSSCGCTPNISCNSH